MKENLSGKPADITRLKEISHWISSVYDLDQLLELITMTATRMMDAKASSLLLLDEKKDRLYFKVATGDKKEDVKKFELERGKGIAGFVAESGEPLLIKDVTKDDRWYPEISQSIGFETRSIACVPMILEGNTIGVIEIIDRMDGKPFNKEDVNLLTVFGDLAALAIAKARNIERVEKENKNLKDALDRKYLIVGESPGIKKVISDAYKVAQSDATTLIVGESGTGKELIARLVHRAGSRKNKALIVLNCAAMPESLLEDELFGHEKGAYTGAYEQKIGKFELADGGTIFLDEIAEMSPSMQAKLLRVLQEGIFYRIGGVVSISVDVRIISATNKDLDKAVESGTFREDLFYRLNVVKIQIPPLRERKEDIPLISNHFLNVYRQERGASNLVISEKAMERMISYDWPGNIRELKNAIERSVVMGNGKEIFAEDLPISGISDKDFSISTGITLEGAINEFKRSFIVKNLKAANGNRSRAAEKMGIQRTYLSRLIKKYQISD